MSRFRLEQLQTMKQLIKELSTGLRRLTFGNNFESFETTVTIPATSTVTIANRLTFLPTKYIIVSQTGAGQVTKEQDWTEDQLFLYNNGGSSVTITVIFFR